MTGHWDRKRLKQIVSALLSNAVRHGGPGSVEVSVIDLGSEVELIVTDTGPGIDPARLPSLFKPSVDGGVPSATPSASSLWFVHALCHAMGGSIAAGNMPSGGARFRVRLPRTPGNAIARDSPR